MTRTRHLEVTFTPKLSDPFIINKLATATFQPQVFIKFQVEKQVSSEPNRAFLEIYNLSEEHSGALDFKFDLFATFFGARVVIKGGYTETGISQMYSGVITNALTVFEAPNYVTRIECRNNVIELMRRPVTYTVAEGDLKADTILAIIKQSGGKIESEQRSELIRIMNGATYDEEEVITGTLDSVTTVFFNGLPRRAVIYWDDAGVSFTPPGRIAPGRDTTIVSEETGLIGSPKATVSGLEYETTLSPTYRINDPVIVKADATSRLALAASKETITIIVPGLGQIATVAPGIVFSAITVVSKVIHSGDNRGEGDFKTSITTKFVELINQATA